MVCSIADNRPLKRLEQELNLPPRCHGKRRECIQGFETQSGDFVMGLPGTALGYCQALFNKEENPAFQTQKVIRLLQEIEAPWSLSHELFWGYRGAETPDEYVEQGMQPLRGNGRVPILITGLDPAANNEEITSIIKTAPAVPENETVLVRMILRNADSVAGAARIMRGLLRDTRASGKMPKWWPLLQGDLSFGVWEQLRTILGDDWKYVNIAINPFVSREIFDLLKEQITVAQIAIGLAEDMKADGEIFLPTGMKILGAGTSPVYSLPDFVNLLTSAIDMGSSLRPPTIIVLGPSQPGWTDVMNQQRISALLPILRRACDELWRDLTAERREFVWKLAA